METWPPATSQGLWRLGRMAYQKNSRSELQRGTRAAMAAEMALLPTGPAELPPMMSELSPPATPRAVDSSLFPPSPPSLIGATSDNEYESKTEEDKP